MDRLRKELEDFKRGEDETATAPCLPCPAPTINIVNTPCGDGRACSEPPAPEHCKCPSSEENPPPGDREEPTQHEEQPPAEEEQPRPQGAQPPPVEEHEKIPRPAPCPAGQHWHEAREAVDAREAGCYEEEPPPEEEHQGPPPEEEHEEPPPEKEHQEPPRPAPCPAGQHWREAREAGCYEEEPGETPDERHERKERELIEKEEELEKARKEFEDAKKIERVKEEEKIQREREEKEEKKIAEEKEELEKEKEEWKEEHEEKETLPEEEHKEPPPEEEREGCHCDCGQPHLEEPPVEGGEPHVVELPVVIPEKKCTCCQPKVVVMSLEMPLTCETFTREKRDVFQCAIGRVTLPRSLRMLPVCVFVVCLCLGVKEKLEVDAKHTFYCYYAGCWSAGKPM
jgi:hypothetical protein